MKQERTTLGELWAWQSAKRQMVKFYPTDVNQVYPAKHAILYCVAGSLLVKRGENIRVKLGYAEVAEFGSKPKKYKTLELPLNTPVMAVYETDVHHYRKVGPEAFGSFVGTDLMFMTIKDFHTFRAMINFDQLGEEFQKHTCRRLVARPCCRRSEVNGNRVIQLRVLHEMHGEMDGNMMCSVIMELDNGCLLEQRHPIPNSAMIEIRTRQDIDVNAPM